MRTPFDHPNDAAYVAVERLGNRFWLKRLQDMFWSLADSRGRITRIRVDRVAKTWPRSGSIYITREHDLKRFRLYLKGDKFKADPVE